MPGEEEVATKDQKMNNTNTACVEETSEYKMFDEESQQQQVEEKPESATSNMEAEDDDDGVDEVAKSTSTNSSSNNNNKKWKRTLCLITIIGVFIVLFAIGPKIDALGGHKRGSGNSNNICADDFSTLVGMDANEAIECLQGQYPNFNIVAISEGSAVTMDYREDRIRVFTDNQGRVAYTPNIG